MPHIKPFAAVFPNPENVEKVTLYIENLSLEAAKALRQNNTNSFLHMLVPEVENRFQRGSKKELAYKKITENFEAFVNNKVLLEDDCAAFYVYRVTDKEFTQTGIWALTSIDDYLCNAVKKHELTIPARENQLSEYLEQTAIDANPVLITYHPDKEINKLLDDSISQMPFLDFELDSLKHQLWKINNPFVLNLLAERFAKLPAAYVADGHHRAAAAANFGITKRKYNLKHNGKEEYNFFTSVYIAADQLKIYPFYRLVKDLNGLTADQFINKLKEIGQLDEADAFDGGFGIILDSKRYVFRPSLDYERSQNAVDKLNVSYLQDFILEPILGIINPRADERISFLSDKNGLSDLPAIMEQSGFLVAFILPVIKVEQLFEVAECGETMPPKSTYFEPKFPAGLLIHQLD